MPVHVLGFHAGYRCRHAGVCCKSGWTIPVEAPLYRTLQSAIAWGHLRLETDPHAPELFEPAERLPHGEPAVLRHKADGSCVFFEPKRGNLCAIQRQMGHAHLPSACRHFPRVVVLDPRGTFITLSHGTGDALSHRCAQLPPCPSRSPSNPDIAAAGTSAVPAT